MAMTSTKPYLIRAFNEWILDNQLTPYLLINAEAARVYVPKEYVEEGKIVLNITPGIVSALSITDEIVEFDARFSGRLKHIYAPVSAVLAIYAKENGQGMAFEPGMDKIESELEEGGEGGASEDEGGVSNVPSTASSTDPKKPPKRGKPKLTVVK